METVVQRAVRSLMKRDGFSSSTAYEDLQRLAVEVNLPLDVVAEMILLG